MTKILSAVACLLLTACGPPRAPTAAIRDVGTVAIRDVTLVDVVNGSLRNKHTVLLTGNRISAVGPTDQVRIPGDANLLDGSGGFLIPGLWDMHVHSVANVTWDMEVRSISNAEWHFPLFLAYGVTSVRNMNDATADPALDRGAQGVDAVRLSHRPESNAPPAAARSGDRARRGA